MLAILRINESLILPLLVLLFLASHLLCEYCFQTQLVSECALMCIEQTLPLHFEAEKRRCCCRKDDDVSTLHTIIKGTVLFTTMIISQEYSEPRQASEMELITKLINDLQLVTIFVKDFIIDVWDGSENVSESSLAFSKISISTKLKKRLKAVGYFH